MPFPSTSIPHPAIPTEPGIGGKPPDHRPPTGGGGGGGGDDGNSRREPRNAILRARTCLFSVLAGELLLFVVAVLLFYARQHGAHASFEESPFLLPKLLLLNTAALLLSNLTMECARQHIFDEIDALEEWFGLGRPALARSLPWIAATCVLGLLFLAGQIFVLRRLVAQGALGSNVASPSYGFAALLTGLHAAHIALGLLALLFCLTTLQWLGRLESRQIAIDTAAWFWHAMGLVWCVLLLVLVIS
jgi:cytochrome c oxidase subunit 3